MTPEEALNGFIHRVVIVSNDVHEFETTLEAVVLHAKKPFITLGTGGDIQSWAKCHRKVAYTCKKCGSEAFLHKNNNLECTGCGRCGYIVKETGLPAWFGVDNTL